MNWRNQTISKTFWSSLKKFSLINRKAGKVGDCIHFHFYFGFWSLVKELEKRRRLTICLAFIGWPLRDGLWAALEAGSPRSNFTKWVFYVAWRLIKSQWQPAELLSVASQASNKNNPQGKWNIRYLNNGPILLLRYWIGSSALQKGSACRWKQAPSLRSLSNYFRCSISFKCSTSFGSSTVYIL